MTYTYPQSVYDVSENLLATLGSFWSGTFHGGDQLAKTVEAKCQIEGQAMLDVLDAMAAVSRFTVPIFKTRNWYPLVLRESQRNDVTTSLPRYDTGQSYDGGLRYDVPVRRQGHAFPKPADLADGRVLLNRFVSPSLNWTQGIDFVLEDGAIVFAVNPFEDDRVALRDVYVDGVVTDREAVLWLLRGDFDWDAIYRQFGYVIRMKLRSSAGYRDLLNAVFNALVGGTTRATMIAGLSAVTGIPVVREATETVEDVWMDGRGRLVITDRNVYRFEADATVLVSAGDVVHAGDPLVDALRIFEFNHGDTPTDLAALAMGRGFSLNCLYSDLVFENRELPLTVITDDPSGFTKVTWPLGGFPADVARFFDELHSRGVTEAERAIGDCEECTTLRYPTTTCGEDDEYCRLGTLAHYLDRRTNRVGEPTAANLPTTINPLKFLITNVLRNNAFLVRIRAAHLGANGLGLHNLRYLQQVVPPHTAMLLMVDMTPRQDSITVRGLSERLTTFSAAEPLVDVVPAACVRDRSRPRIVTGRCG